MNLVKTQNYLRQVSASSFALFEFCPFAWRRRYRQGINLTWESPDRDSESDSDFTGGAGTGSLAHWILARWPVNKNFEAELEYYLNDREIISRLPVHVRDTWRNARNKKALSEWLLSFASSEIGIELRNNKNIKRLA